MVALIETVLYRYSRASSTHEPPTRPNLHVGACPNWQRDAPPSCAPATPPAGRHAQRAKRPRIRQEPSAKRPHAAPAAPQPGSPPQQQARFHLDGPRCAMSPRPPTEGSGPVLGPCTRPNPEAEAKAEAESRRGPRLLRANSSDPHINRVLTATRFGQRRLRCACLNRMQPVARQRSSVQPVAACAVRSGIAHRWHSVATQCMWLQHSVLRCCVTPVLRRGRCPGGQQWWHRCRRGIDWVAMGAGLD
jgi:hypothetical protein